MPKKEEELQKDTKCVNKNGRRNPGKGRRNNNNNHNRSKGKAAPNNSGDSRDYEVRDIKDRTNDPSWYASNPKLLESAGSFAFSNVLGTDLGFTNMSKSIPGIMTITWVPELGTNDPAVIATRNIYSYVRHANSGASNYDAPDLMMYILAVDSAFSYIASLIRIYGLMRFFNQKNRYVAKALVEALGCNYDSLLDNLANFNYFINTLIARASVLWVPDTMPLIERHYWMNSNIYTDGANAKSQLYAYVQLGFYKYNPTKTPEGGGLDFMSFYGTPGAKTYADLVNFANELFSQLDSNNEDFGIMGGDILKAYGKEHLYTINEIPFDYSIAPIYSVEVLTQIHNCTACNIAPTGVQQDARGNIRTVYATRDTQPKVWNCLPNRVLIDFFQQDTPSPEQVMVATRLTALFNMGWVEVSSGGKTTWSLSGLEVGTELAYGFRIFFFDSTQPNVLQSFPYASYMPLSNVVPSFINLYTKFDWAPYIYVSQNENTASTFEVIGDVEQYTTMQVSDLNKLHTTATWSEFGIPAM